MRFMAAGLIALALTTVSFSQAPQRGRGGRGAARIGGVGCAEGLVEEPDPIQDRVQGAVEPAAGGVGIVVHGGSPFDALRNLRFLGPGCQSGRLTPR